jgi:hypothetical protein
VDVRLEADARTGIHETVERVLDDRTAPSRNRDFDDSIDRGVEPGHLQVDEGERRFGDGEIPGTAVRRFAGAGPFVG